MENAKPIVLNLTEEQLGALDYALRNIAYGRFKPREYAALCESIIPQLPSLYSAP